MKNPLTPAAAADSDAAQESPEVLAARKQRDDDHAVYLQKTAAEHNKRILAQIDGGMTLTGVRLSSLKDEHATGSVVTLSPDEGTQVTALVKKLVGARK